MQTHFDQPSWFLVMEIHSADYPAVVNSVYDTAWLVFVRVEIDKSAIFERSGGRDSGF
jgi:hypothetical protein